MKHKGTPAYTPMCNSHLRFYFSDPKRVTFRNAVEERQFQTVKKIISSLPANKFEIIRELILPNGEHVDISDSYLRRRINQRAMDEGKQPGYYYRLFQRLTKRIAIELNYISVPEKEQTITWRFIP